MSIGEMLNYYADRFESDQFVESDPISVPHRFTRKEDIEISAFFSSSLAWGRRSAIISAANRLMQWMDESPYDFIMNAGEPDLKRLDKFVYRTFQGGDLLFFVESLKHIYKEKNGLESVFTSYYSQNRMVIDALIGFRSEFFALPHLSRTEKHVSSALTGSACKRLNLFLRWMVRSSEKGVDFGLWKGISSSDLLIPLDVHTANTARKLGLLLRKQNDLKSVLELSDLLRGFKPSDPVSFDFALFGLGIEKIVT